MEVIVTSEANKGAHTKQATSTWMSVIKRKVKIRLDLSGCLDTVVALKPTKRAQTIALLIVDAGL